MTRNIDELVQYLFEIVDALRGEGYPEMARVVNNSAAAIRELQAENFSLAAGQCLFNDGSGLTGDDHGNQYCAMKRRAEAAEANLAELQAQKPIGYLDRFDCFFPTAVAGLEMREIYAKPVPAVDLAAQELRNIVNAKRFDRESFTSDTEFADWVQSRARHILASVPAVDLAERERDKADAERYRMWATEESIASLMSDAEAWRKQKVDLAEFNRDAERYRWLREHSAYVGVNPHHRTCLWTLRDVYEIPGKGFDDAVDAALNKLGGK